MSISFIGKRERQSLMTGTYSLMPLTPFSIIGASAGQSDWKTWMFESIVFNSLA